MRSDTNVLQALQTLAAKYPDLHADLARQAMEFALSRIKARAYGVWTQAGLFTRPSLEQASAPQIAAVHATQFQGCNRVLEICCGAGFDTAALARSAKNVVAIERDTAVAAMARHNLAVQNITNVEVITGDALEMLTTLDPDQFDGVWCDPARRGSSGRRFVDPESYSPPLTKLLNIRIQGPVGIKISPAATLGPLAPGWARQWIGYAKECREQVLWRDASYTDGAVTLADLNQTWSPSPTASENVAFIAPERLTKLDGAYVIEPHNALIRSGRLQQFCSERAFLLFDPNIAYAVSEREPSHSPLYTAFSVIESFPYALKRLRRRLHELQWGARTELKKRGFPIAPERLRPKLRLPDSQRFGVVIIARIGAGHWVFLAQRCNPMA